MPVRTERAHLNTTGGKVWDAAVSLLDFLKQRLLRHLRDDTPLRILELGSGCGFLGMSIADHFGDKVHVVMTEQENEGGLDWLQHNLSLNPHLLNVEALPLDWITVPAHFKDHRWDVMIGSELVYSPITCQLLPSCIKQLLQPSTICYYGHNMNRFESLDIQLIDNFKSMGMIVETNIADSLPSGLSDVLFPDLVLEIFTIRTVL